uniref:3-dehydroquinate synthase n=1 Tax=Solanum tuberosum TaxID=4113 RepID=M1B3G7_SOLTU
MKVEDVGAILELKGYFDRRHDVDSLLNLTKAIITHIQVTGMGDRVCVDICSLMRPGEGWILCKRAFPCSLRMLGVKLHL